MKRTDKDEELRRLKKELRDAQKKNERLAEKLQAAKRENKRLKGSGRRKKKADPGQLALLTEKELEAIAAVFPGIGTKS